VTYPDSSIIIVGNRSLIWAALAGLPDWKIISLKLVWDIRPA
jgi:hypothetical protein